MKEIIINDRHFIVEDYTEPKVFYNEKADEVIKILNKKEN